MRTIPVALADHYASKRTSLCRLFKFVRKDGELLTYTTADHTIVYDDGNGDVTYPAINAASRSAMDATASLGVDNAMMTGLLSNSGLTEAQVRAGVLSHARWWVYEVNYMNLTDGHKIVGSGFTGETILGEGTFRVELRGKTQLLKQPINESYELTCPWIFGSPECGRPLEWHDATVDTVDTSEPDRIFTITPGSGWPGIDFTNGVLRVTSGDNAGAEVDIESDDSNGISLMLPLPYPIEPGDGVELRIDCNKEARDAVGGCLSELRWGEDWVEHHGGFPDIPVAARDSLMSPGAQIIGGTNGGGTIPMESE